MPVFRYINFLCEQTELDALLNQYGSEGWRLHTCEPVVTMGPQGSGLLHAFVVMDKVVDIVIEQNMQDNVSVRSDARGVTIDFKGDVAFQTGSADLSSAAKSLTIRGC